jgi:hypothetical protein
MEGRDLREVSLIHLINIYGELGLVTMIHVRLLQRPFWTTFAQKPAINACAVEAVSVFTRLTSSLGPRATVIIHTT